jgi:HAD superfamily hydrolase (TIGR01509 family)
MQHNGIGRSVNEHRIEAVVFDMDGVLLDSEPVWHEVRRDFVAAHSGRWEEQDQRAMMGANSAQWSAYIRGHFHLALTEKEIYGAVVMALRDRYSRTLPLLPGAGAAVRRLSSAFRLGLASSSPAELIDFVLSSARLSRCFATVVSSDDVARGKPAPDVYLRACSLLEVEPQRAAAVEDSSNGIRAAWAAGMAVVAVPNPSFPASAEALALASAVLPSLEPLTEDFVNALR